MGLKNNPVFVFIQVYIFYQQLYITVCCAFTCSIKAELTAFICDLGSNLVPETGVSGQYRAINTNHPVEHKTASVEVNPKVTPCTISLQCQKRRCYVVAQIYGDQKKECKCIRAYHVFCFVAFLELKISVFVQALDYGL